jgi:predicted Zn-dependent peptidase
VEFQNYATYGEKNPTTFTLTNDELDKLTIADLASSLQKIWQLEHSIAFYAPQSLDELTKLTEIHHKAPKRLLPVDKASRFEPLDTDKEIIYFAHYDANQSYLQTITKGIPYSKELLPEINLYNAYFGGGMNAIVFQEMREKRGLAYSSSAAYRSPSTPEGVFMNVSFIATQNDKVIEAFEAFNDLFNNIPLSKNAFQLAKEQIITDIQTERITKSGIIYTYLNDKKFGFDTDRRKLFYSQTPKMSLEEMKAFNEKYIKEKPKTYFILGNRDQMNFDELEKRFGKVIKLTESDLFNY